MSGGGGHGGGGGHAPAKKHRGGGHEEEHENHERWLVSYADMMTLLMALFLVMFAMSTIDKVKFQQLAQGLSIGFGKPEYAPLEGGDGILLKSDSQIDPVPLDSLSVNVPAVEPGEFQSSDRPSSAAGSADDIERAKAEAQRLEAVAAAVDASLAGQGLSGRADYRIDDRGLVIALVADDVLFLSGRAELQPGGLAILDAVAPVLQGIPDELDVEGHANHLPVAAGSPYPSNWELSAARAASVVRHLIESDGLAAGRLSAIGYSDTRPLVPPEDPTSIGRNRRVDIVVVSDETAPVRALLPQVAGELPTGAP